MPRYFVHLCDRSASVFDDASVFDEDGIELADEAAAHKHAIWCIRDVVSTSVLTDQPVSLASYMTIRSNAGVELRRVHFREAVSFLIDDTVKAERRGWSG